MTKLVAKLATAAALVALATPALPCEGMKTTTAEKKTDKAAAVAKKDAKDSKAAKAASESRTDQVQTASAKPAK